MTRYYKKMMIALPMVVACVLLGFSPVGAVIVTYDDGNTVTTLFEDGFEAGTIDSPPGPAITGNWSFSNGGSGGHLDVSTEGVNHAGMTGPAAFEGSQYFQFHSISGDDVRANAFLFNQGSEPTTGILRSEFMLYMPSTGGGQQANAHFRDADGGGGNKWGISAGLRTDHDSAAGPMDYWNGSGWTDLFDDGGDRVTYTLDQWNKWVIELDLENNQATYTIGDTTVGPLDSHSSNNALNFVLESNREAGADKFSYYVDSIRGTTPIDGDTNADGIVGARDLSIWSLHQGDIGVGPSQGDFNGDISVDQFDLDILTTNWHCGEPGNADCQALAGGLLAAEGAHSAVPEPSSLMLFLLGLAVFSCRGRRQ